MIITKTTRYTDWSFQGVHANEVGATVGNGLLFGFIYFRHSYDFLQEGDKVIREVHLVELSDGTITEMRDARQEHRVNIQNKVNIVSHGVQPDGTVCLQVFGKVDVGIGVSRVLRDVTVEYDDGRTPVLGDAQLGELLEQLKESLTQSMKDTAEAIKRELRDEMNTRLTTTKQELSQLVSDTDTKLANSVRDLKSTMEGYFRDANSRYEARFAKLEAIRPDVDLSGVEGRLRALEDKDRELTSRIGGAESKADNASQVAQGVQTSFNQFSQSIGGQVTALVSSQRDLQYNFEAFKGESLVAHADYSNRLDRYGRYIEELQRIHNIA